jgi:hypothetical protein
VSVLWYVRHIVVSVVISKKYCCQWCDTHDILLSVLWYVCNMSYISQHWHQYVLRITTVKTICLTYHNTDTNMSYVSQHLQQYILRITSLTTICLAHNKIDKLLSVLWYIRHIVDIVVMRKRYRCQYCDAHNKIDNNISYVSQNWQQYVLRISTLTTIFLAYHKNIKNMSLSWLWYVRHIVISVVIRKTYCC